MKLLISFADLETRTRPQAGIWGRVHLRRFALTVWRLSEPLTSRAVTKSGTGTWDGDVGLGTWGLGDVGTWGPGDSGTWGPGDSGTWGRGDSGTWGRGDSGTWGRGDTFSKYRISEMGQHRQES